MRYLGILVLMALILGLSACDVTRAAAPLTVNLPSATQAPKVAHVPPAEQPVTVVNRIYVPTGLKVEGAIPGSVLGRFYRLAFLYPEVANKTKRIVARRAGSKGWAISYERSVIYINIDKGFYVLMDALTDQFSKRAYEHVKRFNHGWRQVFPTWKVFAAWLRTGVR